MAHLVPLLGTEVAHRPFQGGDRVAAEALPESSSQRGFPSHLSDEETQAGLRAPSSWLLVSGA